MRGTVQCPECKKVRKWRLSDYGKPPIRLCNRCNDLAIHAAVVRNRRIKDIVRDRFYKCLQDPCQSSGGCQPGDEYTGHELHERIKTDLVGIGAVFEDIFSFAKYTIIAAPFDGLDFVRLEETHGSCIE